MKILSSGTVIKSLTNGSGEGAGNTLADVWCLLSFMLCTRIFSPRLIASYQCELNLSWEKMCILGSSTLLKVLKESRNMWKEVTQNLCVEHLHELGCTGHTDT